MCILVFYKIACWCPMCILPKKKIEFAIFSKWPLKTLLYHLLSHRILKRNPKTLLKLETLTLLPFYPAHLLALPPSPRTVTHSHTLINHTPVVDLKHVNVDYPLSTTYWLEMFRFVYVSKSCFFVSSRVENKNKK